MMSPQVANLVEQFKAERRRLGLSQAQVASRAGVAVDTVSRFERKMHDTSCAVVLKLLEVVGLRMVVVEDASCP